MEPAAEEAVDALRRAIARERPSPAAFRDRLEAIPIDERDAWFDRLWGIEDLPDDEPLPRGCVPYLPADVATILQALDAAAVRADDVFVDIGAGLGRVVALARLCTGARCVGVEIQPSLARATRQRAHALRLDGIDVVEGDAAQRPNALADGTVFFLYCPFGGDRLDRVLGRLRDLARTRPIRICCVGMPPLRQPWLQPAAETSVDLAVYRGAVAADPPPDPTLGPT